jgi:hypothetical protein
MLRIELLVEPRLKEVLLRAPGLTISRLSTGQKMILNLLYDIKRSEQMASLSDQNDVVELRS